MTTILCIEDEDALREDIVEELIDEGYQVLSARNGAEGFKIISENYDLDLVLSDITMPVMNGFELLKQVREHEGAFADVPFVFLSALSDRDQIVEGKRLGADDYVIKPINYDLLFATIAARVRQVERMKQRKEKDMIVLYKALSHGDVQKTIQELSTSSSTIAPSVPDQQMNVVNSVSPVPLKLPSTGKIVAGRFLLLGLEKIKEKLGDKFDSHMNKIQNTMQGVVDKNLGPGDVYKALDDGDIMISFPNLTEQEASYKLEIMEKEIWVKILGDDEYQEELVLKSQVFEVEIDEKEYANAPDPWSLIQNKINSAAAAAQRRVNSLIEDILERAKISFAKVQNPKGNILPLSIATYDTFGLQKLKSINQVVDISDQRCLIVEGGYIGQTVEYMIAGLADIGAETIIMKLSFQLCIHKAEFENTLTILGELTPQARKRLIISIVDVPKRLHLALLSDLMGRLRPFCKMRMTEFQLEMPGDPSFEMVGVSILMLDYFEAVALLKHSKYKFIQAVKSLKLKKTKLLIMNTPSNKSHNCSDFGADFVHLKNMDV